MLVLGSSPSLPLPSILAMVVMPQRVCAGVGVALLCACMLTRGHRGHCHTGGGGGHIAACVRAC